MKATYKSIIVTQRGGPEVLQIVENELVSPAAGQVRIKVLTTGVGGTDINYRYGRSPFAPKPPFVPGYEVMGIVDAVGEGVTRATVGDRVAALTGHGSYTEMMYLGQEHLAPVPASVSPADAVVVALNYVTAYQMLYRAAKVKAGDKVLLIAAIASIVIILLGIVTYFIWPYSPENKSTEEILLLLQSDPFGRLVSLDLFLFIGNLFSIFLFLTLYVSLKTVNESYALAAIAVGLVGLVLLISSRPILRYSPSAGSTPPQPPQPPKARFSLQPLLCSPFSMVPAGS